MTSWRFFHVPSRFHKDDAQKIAHLLGLDENEIEEEFGDSIMSAIDFELSVKWIPDPKETMLRCRSTASFFRSVCIS
jgi:cyanate lyase